MFSQRGLRDRVSRCCGYEFENTICSMDSVDLFTPARSSLSGVFEKALNRALGHTSIVKTVNPGIHGLSMEREYDLFFAVCQFPSDLVSLNGLRDWRKRCRVAVCWLEEFWASEIHRWKGQLELLRQFDHVFLNCSASVDAVANYTKRPCYYSPPGVDCVAFCPYPQEPARSISVCNIGRRSPVTHKALLQLAGLGEIFYVYDTLDLSNVRVLEPLEHRSLLANFVKRSRYFVANQAKANRPYETSGQEEVGFRFFEGAAGGAVLIGDAPHCDAFHENFDWPDAVIPIPYDCPGIGTVLAGLDRQPQRLAAIRRNNIVNSLRRHDWVYRWSSILQSVGLAETHEMGARKKKLTELADLAGREADCPEWGNPAHGVLPG